MRFTRLRFTRLRFTIRDEFMFRTNKYQINKYQINKYQTSNLFLYAILYVIIIGIFFVLSMVPTVAATVAAINASDYLYTVESPSALTEQSISYEGTNYSLVSLGGNEIFLIKGDKFVTDKTEIKDVLKQDCFTNNYPESDDLDGIKDKLLDFNASRNSETSFGGAETVCNFRSAQDSHPCSDDESCMTACFSQYTCMLVYQFGAADFLNELVDFALAKIAFNGNLTSALSVIDEIKSVSSINQLTFNISDKLNLLKKDIEDIDSTADTLLESKLYEGTAKYNFCPTPALDKSAISSALSKVSSLKSGVACFDTIQSKADEIYDETLERAEYYKSTKQKADYQERFNELSTQFNGLESNSTSITEIFKDEEIDGYISKMENYSASFYTQMADKEYDLVGQTISRIDSLVEDFDEYLDSVSGSSSNLIKARNNASSAVEKTGLLLSPSDVTLNERFKVIKEEFDDLEVEMSEKIEYQEAENFISGYNSIANKSLEIISERGELEVSAAPSLLAGVMKGVSLSVLGVISEPLGIRENEKRAWMSSMPIIILVITDLLILTIASVLFLILIWRKSTKFLRKDILKTWGLIFGVLILLLIGITFAINTMLSSEIGATSALTYLNYIEDSNEVVIFKDYSSLENSTSLVACSQKLESRFESINKTVKIVDVIDGVCGEVLFSECLRDVGDVPIIRLEYSDKNETSFYTFYRVEAEISGDESYIAACILEKLIGS